LLVQSFHFQIWHMQQTTVHRCFQEGRVLWLISVHNWSKSILNPLKIHDISWLISFFSATIIKIYAKWERKVVWCRALMIQPAPMISWCLYSEKVHWSQKKIKIYKLFITI
jgi:hypothetical protein